MSLIVAVFTLLRQRGEIDCGGLRYAVIRYGNFFEFVLPLKEGHLSVGIDGTADAVALATAISRLPAVAAVAH